jgi:hydrogenase-4 component E
VNHALFDQLLDLAAGAFLLCAVGVLWRRELAALIRLLALQGAALAVIVALLAAHDHSVELAAVAVVVAVLKAVVVPRLLRRTLTGDGQPREAAPLVNVAASLLAAAVLSLLAYAAAQPLVELTDSAAGRAAPVGLAVVLIGFFALATRRRALSQITGMLLVDNGIAATTFLATASVPLIVELGVSLDLLLAVLVLQVLTTRLTIAHGVADLHELRELHD